MRQLDEQTFRKGESVKVVRDAGYKKDMVLSPEYRKEARERIENPNILAGNYKLKELLEEFGIVVNPERMTNWYVYTGQKLGASNS